MLHTAKVNEELYQKARELVTDVHAKVLKILKRGENVVVSNGEYMPCYNAVIKACDSSQEPTANKDEKIQNNEERLFNWFKQLIKEYLLGDVQESNLIMDQEQYIEKVYKQYKNFQIYLHWLSRLFYYLDQFFLKNKNSTLHVEGFKIYRDDYFQIINNKLFNHIVNFQKMAREDQSIPRETVKRLIQIYQEVGFKKTVKLKKIANSSEFAYEVDDGSKYYEDNFQAKFADEMEQYYLKRVNEWSNLSTPEYVEQALKSLQKEEEIAQYFYSKSQKIIVNRIEQIVIQQQSETLANNEQTGLYSMLKEKKENEMKNLYKLFKRVAETLDHVAKKLGQYINYHGNIFNEQSDSRKSEGVTQKDIAVEFVQKVFALKKECDHLVQDVFNQDITIQKARDNAFQNFLNKNDKSTFFLATHADIILKQEGLQNEQEIEDRVQEIVGIFVYFYSRDTFFKHYQKFFSNRLLNATSRNKEAEKSLIARFKTEAGQTGVNKIETMLKDINNSEEFNQDNRKHISPLGIELNVSVLTTGSWPIANTQEKVSTPQVLKSSIEKFEQLYKSKYKGRNINWLYSQGTAEMQFRSKEKYLLIVNSYQMVALLSIQSQANTISYQKLVQISGIPENELEFLLMPFVKLKILNKSDEGDAFNNNSELSINSQFQNKLKKIKCIPGGKQAQQKKQKEDDEGRTQFMEEMNREREFIVDACIVRIMKSRKTMKHNDLFPEVIKLINNFKPEIPLIKRRIESLLDRDYLKRDENDRNTFIYVP
ncbi:cullin family protein (macronuclear) [Tetrahymena thermophila SB210]|uniref:Cullin family protein n=1 Tax=Tetrahymena thermophila (strain SB210) TaxID=312017 RepID=Q237B9_TETTS|nr:cullin family protein [Tetrahymena thermophila SB210]EAR92331.1 cullin family protein [Tetrahymena thermophila SB210]|eukprot:XP_001012576.1 cullin family protein [Tetrahymena thermophila SB210]